MTESNYNRYLAVPQSGTGAGVLVVHAWWGLTDFIKEFCDRLAQEGYVALAPDLFSGRLARTVQEAEQLISVVEEEKNAPPIVLRAVEELSKHPAVTGNGLAVIGFSMGAYWSLWLAQQKPEIIRAVTLFYGTNGGGGDFQQSKSAFLGHFAVNDPYESPEVVKELEKNLIGAGCPVNFYTYPGTGHWFFEKDRTDAYNQPSAQKAWERTVAFLREQLKG